MKQMLVNNKCIDIEKPTIVPIYFKNIKRCRIGPLRAALRQILPSWAVLGLSFVGGSILEVLSDIKLESRVVHLMKVINVRQVRGFNILRDGVKKEVKEDDVYLKNVQAAKRRFARCIQTCRSEYAKDWYSRQVDRCHEILQTIQSREIEAEKSVIENGNEDRSEWIVVKQTKRKQVAPYSDITISKRAAIPTELTPMEIAENTEEKEEIENLGTKEEDMNEEMIQAEDEDWLLEEEPDDSPSITDEEKEDENLDGEQIDEENIAKQEV